MLDFTAVRNRKMSLADLIVDLTRDDLHHLTNAMVDRILELIEGCLDADVTFPAIDPQANDTFASKPEDVSLSWNLGHVIVHTTASAEESAALACELARGVAFHGRSRYEVPWQSVTRISDCRQRLEESRRIRLASLQMWPDKPDLNNIYEPWPGASCINAIGRFVYGLMHDDSHLSQISVIVHQATSARSK
jgi:hypothetical protein